MRQNGLAEQADYLDRTDPNRTWDEIYNKYGGDPKAIIESAFQNEEIGLRLCR